MSLDPALNINGFKVVLGTSLDESAMAKEGIAKAGMAMRFSLRNRTHFEDVIYWAKKPSFSFFDGEVTAFANLKTRPRTSRWDPSPADFINGTSAFLFFNRGSLRCAIVQVIMSYVWANGFIDDFRKTATPILGDANCSELSQVPFQKPQSKFFRSLYRTVEWENDTSILLSQISENGKNALVQWNRK
jgi:hypothetical protein